MATKGEEETTMQATERSYREMNGRAARKRLLVKEKELNRQRDALSAERRQSCRWGRSSRRSTSSRGRGGDAARSPICSEGKRQLLVYHFMFGPDYDEGCPACSFDSRQLRGQPRAPRCSRELPHSP